MQNRRAADLAKVDVYLKNFTSTCQGGRSEQTQMVQHLFRTIYKVFHSNRSRNSVKKEPIFQKILRQRDYTWSTCKVILGWDLYTCRHLLCLPTTQEANSTMDLTTIPPKACSCFLHKWRRLLGILQRITTTFTGEGVCSHKCNTP